MILIKLIYIFIKTTCNKIISLVLLGFVIFLFISATKQQDRIKINLDAKHLSYDTIPNIASNINIWEIGNSFYDPQQEFLEYNEFKFVHWVQLMLCSGGSKSRDLFKNPEDRNTLTDYNFERLIKNCEGILSLGAKPHLKLGAVPLKFTTNPKINSSNFNIYPPDSYKQYYNFIKALGEALVKHFGKKEILTWRFGCLDEYENGSCFQARSGKPEDSFEEYCKLYDYTTQALIDVLGEDVFIGAHSMSVLKGLWDERKFIEHTAKGRNWANGKIGTKLSYLSVSFYDNAPGKPLWNSLTKTITPLQNKAQECGLNNLIFGVDEGRVLSGTKGRNSSNLLSRSCGYTWQAAEDARLYAEAITCGMDYFSSWSYLTGGNFHGFPTVSYHVAKNIAALAGYKKVKIVNPLRKDNNGEIGCIAGVKADTVRLMLYNYSNDIHSRKISDFDLNIDLPFHNKGLKIKSWLVDDNCNFFDEWQADQRKYKISNSAFFWSPEDGEVEARIILRDEKARKIYNERLRNKYIACSKLNPQTKKVKIQDGKYSIKLILQANTVLFLKIAKE